MDDLLEDVVAENRLLRHELKALNERLAAIEASRWWRLHPRLVVGRMQGTPGRDSPQGRPHARVARLVRQWRLRREHARRNGGSPADEIVMRDGIRLRIHPESRAQYEVFCFWSPEGVDELDSFIAATSDRRRLLDVGAAHGVFSLVFAAHDSAKSVLAVEASPLGFAPLLYNIQKNRANNISARECALSNDVGTLEMHYHGKYAIAGSDRDGRTLQVASQTGDALCAECAFEPDVIKIDVEGHEFEVLQGLRRTIQRNKPLIFLEVHRAMMTATLSDLGRLLRELGYPSTALRGETDAERILLRPGL